MKTNLQRSLFLLMLFILTGCSSFKPKEIGLLNESLRPCPPAPKCVSSLYEKGIHHIDPLIYQGSKEDAYQKIITIIQNLDRSEIVKQTSNYIHAQFTVTPFNWIDDVEFVFSSDSEIVHFSSSASAPIGYWDWGENKRRAKIIIQKFNQPSP